jgi:outer membrane immunogenic protein
MRFITIQKLLLITLLTLSAPVFSDEKFNGPYVGVQIGYADGKHHGEEFEDDGTLTGYTYKNTTNKILLGGLAGYYKTFSNNILIGVEADYDYRNASKKSIELQDGIPSIDYTTQSKINTTASLRAKLGVIFKNKTLAYITGGYAGADIKTTYNSDNVVSPGTSSNTQWHNGFILGFGAEHYINDKISAKAEYRYADFGEKNANVAIEQYFNYRQNYDKENSVRIGLNYHF